MNYLLLKTIVADAAFFKALFPCKLLPYSAIIIKTIRCASNEKRLAILLGLAQYGGTLGSQWIWLQKKFCVS
jgi:hypothetical protein